MDTSVHNKLVSFIWSIADDCLRDVYVRGKYRDVILPMIVLRRLDVLLEPSKDAVIEEINFQRENDFEELDLEALKMASGYSFYNSSKWTLQLLKDTAGNSQQILLTNFEEYLNGYGPNVTEIIEKFNLKAQIRHMASKDVLLNVLEKFTSSDINLTPEEKLDSEGKKLPPLTNLGMGYVFEELIRKFNEENNEEAGEHFTPREVIDLMTHMVFDPIKEKLPDPMTIYDPACGSGGMLTEAQNFIQDPQGQIRATDHDILLFGKEINDETYAICKSDMMIKDNSPENIRVGSTLSSNEFQGKHFDFMLSNPPYGKSWASEQKYIKEGKEVIDPRFEIELADYWGEEQTVEATPRSSDGQLLFLMEMVDKMKSTAQSPLGSRIASVHNGSSLFTGDAGGGESNIRRYIIENDLLDCIIQLPNNLFYNTGITTYIWMLSSSKPAQRQGKVILIDASKRFAKLRKNLGAKNCELTPGHIKEIQDAYMAFSDIDRNGNDDALCAKVFNNADFGYYKVSIDRPQRLRSQFTAEAIAPLRFDKTLFEPMQYAYNTYGEKVYTDLDAIKEELLAWCEQNDIELNAKKRKTLTDAKTWAKHQTLVSTAALLLGKMGSEVFMDYKQFTAEVDTILKAEKIKLSGSEKGAILGAVSTYDEQAEKVIKKHVKLSGDKLELLLDRLGCTPEQLPDFGYYPSGKKDEYITYASDSDLRDAESIPLSDTIHNYFLKEVKPHVDEAWIDLEKTKIGYEISFNKYFYQHKSLRTIDEVAADILSLEKENEGLIAQILNVF